MGLNDPRERAKRKLLDARLFQEKVKQPHVEAALRGAAKWVEGRLRRSGGRPRGTIKPDRPSNIELAREFLSQPSSGKSPSARKAAIGKKHGLARSTSILLIDRGLKELSEQQS